MRNLPGNIVADDPRPFTGKRQRGCTALSVRSAGDECNFTFEVTSHVAKTYFNEAPDVRRLRSEQWSIGFPVLIQVLIELYLQHIVNDVRCDHQSSKGRERHNLLRCEEARDLLIKLIGYSIARLRDGPSKS